MASILDLSDEFGENLVAEQNHPEHEADPSIAFNNTEANMHNGLLGALDSLASSVSPLNSASYYVDQNFSGLGYPDWGSNINNNSYPVHGHSMQVEQAAPRGTTSQGVPNFIDLGYNNFNSGLSSSNIRGNIDGDVGAEQAAPGAITPQFGQNLDGLLYNNYHSGLPSSNIRWRNVDGDVLRAEQAASGEITPQFGQNLDGLRYNNYQSGLSSSNINRMPPVSPLHVRLDRNRKNGANESNASVFNTHTPKVQHSESHATVVLENLQMEEVMPHGRTTTPVGSVSDGASQFDKRQVQLIGKKSKGPLKKGANGRRKQPKTYTCAECNKPFQAKAHLTRHLTCHDGENRFKCAECGVGFKLQAYLTIHERIHFSSFTCSTCNAVFEYKTHLDLHEWKHTHPDYRALVCDICQKPFRREALLSDHKNTHTGARPYECKLCNKTFALRYALHNHRKVHKM